MTRAELTSPQRGDIIVERRHASAVRYVVRLFNGTPQLLYQNREEAIRSATGFAAAQGVGAWYTDDGKAYRRIEAESLTARLGQVVQLGFTLPS